MSLRSRPLALGVRTPAFAAALALALALVGCGSSAHQTGSSAQSQTYAGHGFQITIPTGWRNGANVSAADGATGTVVTAPDNTASVDTHFYPRPSEGVNQALADDVASLATESQGGAIRNIHAHVRTVTVSGASQAKELTETFTNAAGPQRYSDLVVLTPSGALIDIEATASVRAKNFDPESVISSFRLT